MNGVITLQNVLIDGKPATKPINKVIEEERKGKIRKKKIPVNIPRTLASLVSSSIQWSS